MNSRHRRSPHSSHFLGAASFLLLAPLTPAGASLTYTVEDLGTLGGTTSTAYAINDLGDVAGSSTLAPNDTATHAVLFSDGQLTDLGTLGGTSSEALALNNARQLVGYAQTAAGDPHAFLYADGSLTDLGTLGGPSSVAYAINSSGLIAGTATTVQNTSHVGFYFSNGTIRRAAPATAITAVNDQGTLAGYQFFSSGDRAYVRSTAVNGYLYAPDGPGAHAYALNNYGALAGDANILDSSATHAVFWSSPYAPATDLGTLGGTNSQALAINSFGDVVGHSQTIGDAAQHAFLYGNGVMADLNTLLAPSSSATGWTLTDARGINSTGQIAGQGTIAGQSHAFRATPTLSWENPAGGSWASLANWGSAVLGPDRAPHLVFDLGPTSAYTVAVPEGGDLVDLDVRSGDVTLAFSGRTLLTNVLAIHLGTGASHASLTIDGGQIDAATFVTPTTPGSSTTLAVRNAGTFSTDADLSPGTSPGTTASIDVRGFDSHLLAGSLSIGGAGDGKVTLSDGASLVLTAANEGPRTLPIGGPAGTGAGLLSVSSNAMLVDDRHLTLLLHPTGTLDISSSLVYVGALVVDGTLNLSSGSLHTTDRLIVNRSPDAHFNLTGGTLDLETGILVWHYAEDAPSPVPTIRGLLAATYGGGTWNGNGRPGITSTAAAWDPTHSTALAYAEASDLLGLSGADTATWHGETVDAATLLVLYTRYGDANMDGRVDADDYALLDRSFAKHLSTAAHWTDGDFNYDGIIDQQDYLLIDATYGKVHPLSAAFLSLRESEFGAPYVSQLLAAVPEPTSATACLVAALPCLIRRRARRS